MSHGARGLRHCARQGRCAAQHQEPVRITWALASTTLVAHHSPSLARSRAGETCLHIACRLGNVSIVRRLLRYGADTQITGANGNAVQVSMAHGQLEVCQALAQHQYAKQQGEPIPGWEDAFDRDESAISSSSMSSSNGNTTATTATTTTTSSSTTSSNELRTSPTGAVNIRLSRAQSPGVSPASTPSRSFSRNASSPGPESDAATSPGALFKPNTGRLALQPSFLPQFEGLSSDDEYDDDDGGLDADLPTFSAPNLFIDEADDSDLGTPPSSPLRTRRSTRDSSLPVSFADDTIGVTIGRYPTEGSRFNAKPFSLSLSGGDCLLTMLV